MSQNITKEEMDELAAMANVQLSPDETEQLVDELSVVLEYITQLKSLDTSGIEPTAQISGLSNVWRQDEIEPQTLTREQLLKTAPATQEHQIKVPKVL